MARPSPWLYTKPAAEAIGISPRRLQDLRRQGAFTQGKHYRIVSAPSAVRPTYQWHVPNIEKLLEIPLENRA